MFHAPVSDSKQRADSSKVTAAPQQQNAYPTFDGSHAFGMPRVAARIPPPSMPAAARKQHMARLQQAHGNQAVLRMLERSRPAIQPKLVVNEPGDAYEQEADRVADQVMRMPDPELSIAPAPLRLSGKCAACEAEEKAKPLQTKPAGSPEAAAGEAPGIVHEVLRSPGQPLDSATRAFFEPRFGYDFSGVRVHTDDRAAASARSVAALAYTVDSHIAFGPGCYNPTSASGQRLLAHELIHVIQQKPRNSGTNWMVQRQWDSESDTPPDTLVIPPTTISAPPPETLVIPPVTIDTRYDDCVNKANADLNKCQLDAGTYCTRIQILAGVAGGALGAGLGGILGPLGAGIGGLLGAGAGYLLTSDCPQRVAAICQHKSDVAKGQCAEQFPPT